MRLTSHPMISSSRRGVFVFALVLGLAGAALAAPPGFEERFADVNGTRIHYLVGGQGSPVVLLHGYAQTGHMWGPLLPQLAAHHTVIVPDLRGAGGSAKPESGYDKKNMAVDIHELTSSLGLEPGRGRRPRHRPDGRVRLRGAVPAVDRAPRADGRVPARASATGRTCG